MKENVRKQEGWFLYAYVLRTFFSPKKSEKFIPPSTSPAGNTPRIRERKTKQKSLYAYGSLANYSMWKSGKSCFRGRFLARDTLIRDRRGNNPVESIILCEKRILIKNRCTWVAFYIFLSFGNLFIVCLSHLSSRSLI